MTTRTPYGITTLVTAPGQVYSNQLVNAIVAPGAYYYRFEVNFNGVSPDYSDYLPWVIQT